VSVGGEQGAITMGGGEEGGGEDRLPAPPLAWQLCVKITARCVPLFHGTLFYSKYNQNCRAAAFSSPVQQLLIKVSENIQH
jgi:hypothetical protein